MDNILAVVCIAGLVVPLVLGVVAARLPRRAGRE
jgi:uncharacterized membrane-anchored protein YhcB (DUF1043 family)